MAAILVLSVVASVLCGALPGLEVIARIPLLKY